MAKKQRNRTSCSSPVSPTSPTSPTRELINKFNSINRLEPTGTIVSRDQYNHQSDEPLHVVFPTNETLCHWTLFQFCHMFSPLLSESATYVHQIHTATVMSCEQMSSFFSDFQTKFILFAMSRQAISITYFNLPQYIEDLSK
jgi:hypothetical protein